MNQRRRKLLIALGAIAVTGAGGLALSPLIGESMIVSKVRQRLSFLRLDEAGLHAYAKDQIAAYLAKRPTWGRIKYHFVSSFSHSFTKYNNSNDTRSRSERMIDDFCATYLLSTDFFTSGEDKTRLVKYLGFYDPGLPCRNPFARPPLGQQAGA